jgi:predicted pyridoxine 5'-phosphate oxidase superfamily flavin-nucleotide-binding protein
MTSSFDPAAATGFRFHAGERALQTRAGVRERMEFVGPHAIRTAMPDQHRELFERLPYLVVGGRDPAGRPWATMLSGEPGFVRTPDDRTLAVAALPAGDDPFAAVLVAGAPVGVLGIELATRRRNRANGVIARTGPEGFVVAVAESFGNCPKYITPRDVVAVPATSDAEAGRVSEEGERLSARAAALVAATDTFFLATVARPEIGGADVSHRGGPPGFVTIGEHDGGTVLSVPDYPGNAFFNSFGNLEVDARAGLLIVDFATGDTLSLTGTATVAWDRPNGGGTGRTLRFRVSGGWLRPAGTPLRGVPQPAAFPRV